MSTTRVHRIQSVSAVADGAVLTTVVLYFTQDVGLTEGAVGLVLGAAAAGAVLTAAPLGRLADRVGLCRAAAGFSVVVGLALTSYVVAGSLWSYAAAAVLFGVARAGLGATIQAIVAAQTPPAERGLARARLHTLLNAGFGVGAVLGAGVLAVDQHLLYVGLFGAGGLTALTCAGAFLALPAPVGATVGVPTPGHRALRDGRLVTVTALSSVLMLTIPTLSVILPLWIARSAAPLWLAAVAFGLNTVVVFTLQSPWSARVRTDADASRSALAAGAAITVATALFAVVPQLGATTAAAAILLGVLAMTLGEVATGPAAWQLALRDVPADRQGEYQAVFGMSFSAARVVGPLLALPLVTRFGAAGWMAIGAAILAAGLVLAAVGARREAGEQIVARPRVTIS